MTAQIYYNRLLHEIRSAAIFVFPKTFLFHRKQVKFFCFLSEKEKHFIYFAVKQEKYVFCFTENIFLVLKQNCFLVYAGLKTQKYRKSYIFLYFFPNYKFCRNGNPYRTQLWVWKLVFLWKMVVVFKNVLKPFSIYFVFGKPVFAKHTLQKIYL